MSDTDRFHPDSLKDDEWTGGITLEAYERLYAYAAELEARLRAADALAEAVSRNTHHIGYEGMGGHQAANEIREALAAYREAEGEV